MICHYIIFPEDICPVPDYRCFYPLWLAGNAHEPNASMLLPALCAAVGTASDLCQRVHQSMASSDGCIRWAVTLQD